MNGLPEIGMIVVNSLCEPRQVSERDERGMRIQVAPVDGRPSTGLWFHISYFWWCPSVGKRGFMTRDEMLRAIKNRGSSPIYGAIGLVKNGK
jgi:hypothetical protein